ncbi:(Fe-S)-binding protein [Paenibacillus sp. 1001270B_150601_E10]|uniref:(Fe-S)-binding protein n=1 Tax=Paenibacillus sp. 1001270B_150601_E10 TaxID=2787079 RepID=UPI00189F4EFD|nr:(Fe-S)-binding protein [Paenibacillus sp. 1001270B_150601_E10]
MDFRWVEWLLALACIGLSCYWFGIVVWRRWTYVQLGTPTAPQANHQGVKKAILQTFSQGKLWKDWKSGTMHVLLFYGFLHLQIGAIDLILIGLTDRHLPLPFYETFVVAQEWTAILVLAVILYAGYRRYVEKLARLKRSFKSGVVILFITALMISVLGTMLFERVLSGNVASSGSLMAMLAATLSDGSSLLMTICYKAFWWLHLLILLAFLVYVPQSKHFHLIVAPLNLGLKRRDETTGKLNALDLEAEDQESFGVGTIEAFTQHQLVDLYACVECGRCTQVCPAASTGKWLSPMHMITKLRDHLTEKGAAVTSTSPWIPKLASAPYTVHRWEPDQAASHQHEHSPLHRVSIDKTMKIQSMSWRGDHRYTIGSDVDAPSGFQDPRELQLIGDVMSPEEIWACTTCRNCEDQCPVGNEHVDKIIDMRRYLVLTQGELPTDAKRAMTNIERQGNPWGLNRKDRMQWAIDLKQEQGIEIPTVKERPEFDYLLFVGSMGSYDRRSQKVMRDLVRLLHEAQVSFAILGNEEKSSGDTARRLGNEFLFQELAQENIQLFEKYKVRRIVTACPHTYHTMKKEYRDFGLTDEIEVLHHSELLWTLWTEGKLVLRHAVNEQVVWHDSCYLARYNDVVAEPRKLLAAIPALQLLEMERSGKNAMCCGAGGGQMWMEETEGTRVNVERVKQALHRSPSVIGSACPYCLTMMEDGTKHLERQDVATLDLAEIVAKSVLGA